MQLPEGLFPYDPSMLIVSEIKPTFVIVDDIVPEPTPWRDLLDQHIKAAFGQPYSFRVHIPQEVSIDMALHAILHDLLEDEI